MADMRPALPEHSTRVLLVDAVPSRRELFELALRFVGHNVIAVSPHAAGADYEHFAPDLVVVSTDGPSDPASLFHLRLVEAGHITPQIVIATSDVAPRLPAPRPGQQVSVLAAPAALQTVVDAAADALGEGRRFSTVVVGRLAIDPSTQASWYDGEDLPLTPTEFRLLRLLMQNVDRVISKRDILDHVWRYDFGGRTNAVETYVGYLRRKLRPLGAPEIVTIRGKGYLLRRAD